MSIIHDALKKAQQQLASKNAGTPSPDPGATPASGYLYETPPAVEKLPPAPKKLRSVLTNICVILVTTAITIASVEYIYRQFQSSIPRVSHLAITSIHTMIRKIPLLPQPKPAPPVPLAQITVAPAEGAANNGVTLNVHGIMSNNGSNVALINDQVYQEGDEVDGTKIVKISMHSITVDINGTQKTIYVNN